MDETVALFVRENEIVAISPLKDKMIIIFFFFNTKGKCYRAENRLIRVKLM